MKVKNINKRNL